MNPSGARETKVGVGGGGQKPPAHTPYSLPEDYLVLPRDPSPGKWLDCSLLKHAEGSVSSLNPLPCLKIPPHCFYPCATAVLYFLHHPSQPPCRHTHFKDFQSSTNPDLASLLQIRPGSTEVKFPLAQWAINSASSLTVSMQILRIRLTLHLTSASLTAREQQSQDHRALRQNG